MTIINALVLYGYGLNCDMETAYAIELAGAKAQRVHINSIIDGSVSLENFQVMVFVGGFSWGDDHGAGVIQAVRMKTNSGDRLIEFVEKGNLVLGICNGFQTLVNIGLLPGINHDYRSRSVALTFNDCGNFRDDWVHLSINRNSPCVFTRGMDRVELPIRHGEGKFITDKNVFKQISDNHQIVCRYAMPDGLPASGKFPFNPNGSIDDIAGICDSTGRVFGLMPHPEAFNHPTNHPQWTRMKEQIRRGLTPQGAMPMTGIRMFQNAVDFLS
jgi:phosphoribosylformylglycinamidine synthase subunit PurQ / glutaminase